MEIRTLETRIENGKKNLEKLNAKLERINVALAGGPNPYYYRESDLRHTIKEIAAQEESLKKYQVQLEKEINRENGPKIEVLVKFLELWKERANDFYKREALSLHEMFLKEREELAPYISNGCVKNSCYKEYDDVRKNYKTFIINNFSVVTRDLYKKNTESHIDEEKLERLLNEEMKRKYEDLVVRVTKVVGEIKDCGYLTLGDNGSINGRIIGSKSDAYVETIYAGGYNIQCLHYRVLVKPIKK